MQLSLLKFRFLCGHLYIIFVKESSSHNKKMDYIDVRCTVKINRLNWFFLSLHNIIFNYAKTNKKELKNQLKNKTLSKNQLKIRQRIETWRTASYWTGLRKERTKPGPIKNHKEVRLGYCFHFIRIRILILVLALAHSFLSVVVESIILEDG